MECKETPYLGDKGYGNQHDYFQSPENFSGREYYSVEIDSGMGLKEKVEHVHGSDSMQMDFVKGFDEFLNDHIKYQSVVKRFTSYAYRQLNNSQNTKDLIDGFVNSGYVNTLEKLCQPCSGNNLNFYKEYSATHNTTIYEAFLFGPNGMARQVLNEYKKSERLRGQHRSSSMPTNEQSVELYNNATRNTYSLPVFKNKCGDYESFEIEDSKNTLPEGMKNRFADAFGREKILSQTNRYKGTKRLVGDLSYRILEAMTLEVLEKQLAYQNETPSTSISKLEQITEHANGSGKDAFRELYHNSRIDNKSLKTTWNNARKILNDYAFDLWKDRNGFDAECVKVVEKKFPGTIYLNGDRYYWNPKHGETNIQLIPEKDKNKLPGCLTKHTSGGYYWGMTHIKFRRKLVPDGKKFATKSLRTARKLQIKEWDKIQQNEPKLAERIRNVKVWGKATKHKPTAVKIAKKLWDKMQDNDPEMTARILSDRRPDISKPDIDKVWPSWTEQKDRLAYLDNNPQLPIVYPYQCIRKEWDYGLRVPDKLEPIVNKMKRVDWIKNNAMLVFDDNSPMPTNNIAAQSKGQDWTDKQNFENNRCLIQGCSSIDRDSGRFKFTVYDPGYNSPKTLAEEVYHAVFGIMKETKPEMLEAVERWHEKNIKKGGDQTLNISEAFSQAMAEEEFGNRSLLPRSIVKQAKKFFSEKSKVPSEVIANVKQNW